MPAIRPVEPAEIPEVRRLLQEVAAWSEAFGPPVWNEHELACCTRSVPVPQERWLGTFDEQGLVACMRIDTADNIHWPDDLPGEALYVHKVAVARRAAGDGWSARLIGFAFEVASTLGVRFLRLDTLPRDKLMELYRDLGFRLVDPGPCLFAGRELVRMERELAGSHDPM